MAQMPSPAAMFISLFAVIAAGGLPYHLDPFDPAPIPDHEFSQLEPPLVAPKQNSHMLRGSEKLGYGQLPGPEDIAYDPKTGVIYTGCTDGWVRLVTVNDSVVEKWVNTGGRPLGIARGLHGEVFVADACKGLLNISRDGEIELLTDEAEGLKFKLTDGVVVGPNGTIYFTDASFKYNLTEFLCDLLEGRPHGRFLSYDPSTKQTQVLVKDLYFSNGIAVSADQSFVIFCETAKRRCKRYYIQGPRKGSVDTFVQNLPGLPDNIRYDGEGQYWIALNAEAILWKMKQRCPMMRKVIGIAEKYTEWPNNMKYGGVIAVDLDGKPTAHYYDPGLSLVTSGIKIRDYLYSGSVAFSYIIRLNVSQYPAI